MAWYLRARVGQHSAACRLTMASCVPMASCAAVRVCAACVLVLLTRAEKILGTGAVRTICFRRVFCG